ncbi:MAG: hypothetical protein ABSD89_06485 [Halobacteriota archaeon]|jgi:hypothetical protein
MVDVDATISQYGYANFKLIKEDWSVYLLEDETIVKIKVFPVKFLKQGNNYLMNSAPAMTVFSPPQLRGEPSRMAPPSQEEIAKELVKVDMNFDVVDEPWNEYLLDGSIKWSIKTVLVSASSTKKYDPEGEPVYVVNHQMLTKSK